ncbi:MAG: arginine repressor [Phycisphaerales bacterium]
MNRSRRHAVIRDILSERPVASHEALRERLRERGIEVAQATLSRDLRDMGVLKSREGYRLAESLAEPPGSSPETPPVSGEAGRHVVDVAVARDLVVVRTTPGSAGVVALELDRRPPAGVVGTVAGDDTVFVAVGEGASPAGVAERLRRAAGLIPQRRGGAA